MLRYIPYICFFIFASCHQYFIKWLLILSPASLDGKESTCHVGGLGLIPESGTAAANALRQECARDTSMRAIARQHLRPKDTAWVFHYVTDSANFII